MLPKKKFTTKCYCRIFNLLLFQTFRERGPLFQKSVHSFCFISNGLLGTHKKKTSWTIEQNECNWTGSFFLEVWYFEVALSKNFADAHFFFEQCVKVAHCLRDYGAFNLHLLEFTFIYQFYSRKTILVESIFWNPVGLFAFISFHNHFKLSSTLFNLHLFPFKLCGLLRKAELYWQVG